MTIFMLRDGVLQKQTPAIVGDLDRLLDELSASLREGIYVPDPFMRLDIPKREPGETRALHIPSIRERIVALAVRCRLRLRPLRRRHRRMRPHRG